MEMEQLTNNYVAVMAWIPSRGGIIGYSKSIFDVWIVLCICTFK